MRHPSPFPEFPILHFQHMPKIATKLLAIIHHCSWGGTTELKQAFDVHVRSFLIHQLPTIIPPPPTLTRFLLSHPPPLPPNIIFLCCTVGVRHMCAGATYTNCSKTKRNARCSRRKRVRIITQRCHTRTHM